MPVDPEMHQAHCKRLQDETGSSGAIHQDAVRIGDFTGEMHHCICRHAREHATQLGQYRLQVFGRAH